MAAITVDTAPPRLRKGAGRYPQPVALLARLGVNQSRTNAGGLGAALLQDVIARTASVGREIGCRGRRSRTLIPRRPETSTGT